MKQEDHESKREVKKDEEYLGDAAKKIAEDHSKMKEIMIETLRNLLESL